MDSNIKPMCQPQPSVLSGSDPDTAGAPATQQANPLYATTGLDKEVASLQGEVASLKQDADLSAICNLDSELRLLPYTFPHSAIDGGDGGDDTRDGTVGFLVGETVLLTGLAKAPQFNGRKGTILGGYAGGRYPVEVQLLSGETKRIKIKRAPHTSFPCAIPCMNGSTPLTAIASVEYRSYLIRNAQTHLTPCVCDRALFGS